ncbi:MAG: aspartate/glutamate racemase family protein [Candidatus Abyssobacteria bacterium SURF_17]|uniref:Aspartate/glutamate racemase family protein n=1 Tax=Candidatus Abyssobacteria bacterium SURF_17 TaxID=2093361 RepID=A0A419EWI2_9BACT|nr:MAG: aspartate/glutamate racemase family protein [Candidatus Abyssubacteria bacterium SURF_17]
MHKKIGILGGLSPESTVTYYEYITRKYTERFGDYSYPEVIIYSVTFQNYVNWGDSGEWNKITEDMVKVARALERAGADFGIIATNTMHLVFDEVQASVRIPFLHIADATAEAIKARGSSKVGLLGTKFTMTKPFYRERLAAKGISVVVPDAPDMDEVNRVIYEELVRGRLLDSSRKKFVEVISRLGEMGADGVILGCTEIPLLVSQTDSPLTLFDTTSIHAQKALDVAVSGRYPDCGK